jgi:hypothetical protein
LLAYLRVVERLLCKREALSSTPVHQKKKRVLEGRN